MLRLRLLGNSISFSDDEVLSVVKLLVGPGVVWELNFGSWILLQPERINAYAQSVIQTIRDDRFERGCIEEDKVLKGELTYHSSMDRLREDDERFVLLAMHQILVQQGLCMREHTEHGTLLIFPSYYRRERPALIDHPAVLVTYRFEGFLEEVYATLIVRLHNSISFNQDQLWRYAADFKTHSGKQLGLKMNRRAEGAAEVEVYFDPTIPLGEKIIFSKYIHQHILRTAQDVERLRHYVCGHCGTPVGNREVAMERLDHWLHSQPVDLGLSGGKKWSKDADAPTIVCARCEKRVPLWDEMEQAFASPETRQAVRELQTQSRIRLDNESKERLLVGEVISTTALAGQLCREFNVSDHGIDMEIEFRSDSGEATGRKVYLQLKSGDSYLQRRLSDAAEIFKIQSSRHSSYWRDQAFPVMLVIRDSKGETRWIDVREHLRIEWDKGRKPRQIIFTGERFDVMAVRRWREAALAEEVDRKVVPFPPDAE
jgi:Domain of unknown function (DUF4365)